MASVLLLSLTNAVKDKAWSSWKWVNLTGRSARGCIWNSQRLPTCTCRSKTSEWHHLHGNTILMWWSQAAPMHNNVYETAKILSEVDLISDLLLSRRAAPFLFLFFYHFPGCSVYDDWVFSSDVKHLLCEMSSPTPNDSLLHSTHRFSSLSLSVINCHLFRHAIAIFSWMNVYTPTYHRFIEKTQINRLPVTELHLCVRDVWFLSLRTSWFRVRLFFSAPAAASRPWHHSQGPTVLRAPSTRASLTLQITDN